MKNKLKELRLAKNLTQQDAAEALQINKNTYRQYEAGERNIPLDMLFRLADFFDISIDELLMHRLPDRYITVSADEKKMVIQYRNLSSHHQRVTRLVIHELNQPDTEIIQQTTTFRQASRSADYIDELPSEFPENLQDLPDVPGDL